MLAPKIQRYLIALEERNRTRSWCASQLSNLYSVEDNKIDKTNNSESSFESSAGKIEGKNIVSDQHKIVQYRDSVSRLQKSLDHLRRDCANASMSLASKTLSNDERGLELGVKKSRLIMARNELGRLCTSVLISPTSFRGDDDKLATETHVGNCLSNAIRIRVKEVKRKRFQLALQTFEMHRMDVGAEYNELSLSDFLPSNDDPVTTKGRVPHNSQLKRRISEKVLSGTGKIGGFPLPHRGALYKVLPSDVLTSSLRLVASLTHLLARCLGVRLPRPILLRPHLVTDRNSSSGCAVKHQTYDIINSVISRPDWHKLQKVNLGSSNGLNHMTTMEDLEELEEDNNEELNTASVRSNLTEKTFTNNINQSLSSKRASSTSTSTSSLLSLVESSSNMLSRSARRAFDKMKGHQHNYSQSSSRNDVCNNLSSNETRNAASPAMDDISVSTRLRHATCAVICDNIVNYTTQRANADENLKGEEYELRSPHYCSTNSATGALDREMLNQQEENFAMGIHLLQNNVIALSVKAGVPVSALWPAEAILLNLHSLKLYCMEQTLR